MKKSSKWLLLKIRIKKKWKKTWLIGMISYKIKLMTGKIQEVPKSHLNIHKKWQHLGAKVDKKIRQRVKKKHIYSIYGTRYKIRNWIFFVWWLLATLSELLATVFISTVGIKYITLFVKTHTLFFMLIMFFNYKTVH